MTFPGRAPGRHTTRDPEPGLGHCRAAARRPEIHAHLLVVMVAPVAAEAEVGVEATPEKIAGPAASAVVVVGPAVRAH